MEQRAIRRYNFDDIVGRNASFLETVQKAMKASRSELPVLIYGETGTGKELIAQSIHYAGARRDKPFVAQNCAALPRGLFEGILFGTEIGGFTDAINRRGIFEQAHKGTLLLDEVNSLPYEMQGKLLRVLQDDYVRRIGGTRDIEIDVRVIATINEDAEYLIRNSLLRPDLYYRLKVIEIKIPPLRERRDDILLLTGFFIRKYNNILGKNVTGITAAAKKKLLHYDYPGNIRELENIILAAITLIGGRSIVTGEDLYRI